MRIAFELVEALDEAMCHPDPNLNLATYWANRFQCPPDSADYYLALTALMSKFDAFSFALARADLTERSRALYLGAVMNTRGFVHPVSVSAMSLAHLNQQRQQVDLLQLAADALPKELVPEVNQLTLDSLIAELEELLAGLATAEINALLRNLLSAQLSTLLMALRSYDLLGPDGVARIYGAAAAEIARLDRMIPANEPGAKSMSQKVIGAAKKVGAVVVWAHAVVSGAHGILSDGSAILGLPEDGPALIEQVDPLPPTGEIGKA